MTESVTVEIAEIGSISVGKSCLAKRFVDNEFSERTFPTVGSGLFTKNIEVEGMVITMNIWDTAGSERYRSLVPIYVKNANVAFLVFDVTARKTFEDIDEWLKFARQNGPEDLLFCLVGNKCDVEKREIDKEEAEEYAKRNNMPYFETSAKTGENVDQIFKFMAQKYAIKYKESNKDVNPEEDVINNTQKQSKDCGC